MNITKDSVLGFSIIDNRVKIFVKQGSISQSQNTENTTSSTATEEFIKYVNINLENPQSDPYKIFRIFRKSGKPYLTINTENPKVHTYLFNSHRDGVLLNYFNLINSKPDFKNTITVLNPAELNDQLNTVVNKGSIKFE